MDIGHQRNKIIEENYTKDRKVGEGTYAIVYVGRQKSTERQIAIKEIKVGQFNDGLDMSAIREIKFLQELRHINVIELIDVFSSSESLNLVLEFLPADLEMLIKDQSIIFSPGDVKSWMLMTLRGLNHCHRHYTLHRDLKPNNLLLSTSGHLKIADFGLARSISNPRDIMTSNVVTRWYRAPELLLGSNHYTREIDIWSVGAIFAELMLRCPYLAGESDFAQIEVTFRALGSPTQSNWPDFDKISTNSNNNNNIIAGSKYYPPPTRQELRNRFLAASDDALDLLCGMLKLNPTKRLSVEECLNSNYFKLNPKPTRENLLPMTNGMKLAANAEIKLKNNNIQSAESDALDAMKKRGSSAIDNSPRQQQQPSMKLQRTS